MSTRVPLARYPELMDQPCSLADLRACLRDISRVTALTGGYRPTMRWLNHVYGVMPVQPRPLHIVDVGCGYGDFLRRIHRWAQDRHLPVTLTGIDLNPDAVQVARAATIPGTVTYLAGNAHDFHPPQGIDLVISSLVMHHLETREIVDMLDWMESNARLGWFINDLHRQKLPYQAPFACWRASCRGTASSNTMGRCRSCAASAARTGRKCSKPLPSRSVAINSRSTAQPASASRD